MNTKKINTAAVTIEEVLEMFEEKGQCVILNDGQVEGFTDK